METALAFPKVIEAPNVENTPRKSCGEKQTLDIMFAQQTEQGVKMLCGCGCGRVLTRDNLRREHETARKLAAPGVDPDRTSNQRYWCKDPCSLAKDKRDASAIAKSKRIRKETKGSRKPKAKIKSKGFQNGRGGPYKSSFGKKTISVRTK